MVVVYYVRYASAGQRGMHWTLRGPNWRESWRGVARSLGEARYYVNSILDEVCTPGDTVKVVQRYRSPRRPRPQPTTTTPNPVAILADHISGGTSS